MVKKNGILYIKVQISYDDALKIATDASIKWLDNASLEYKNLSHHEIPIKYDDLQKMLEQDLSDI